METLRYNIEVLNLKINEVLKIHTKKKKVKQWES